MLFADDVEAPAPRRSVPSPTPQSLGHNQAPARVKTRVVESRFMQSNKPSINPTAANVSGSRQQVEGLLGQQGAVGGQVLSSRPTNVSRTNVHCKQEVKATSRTSVHGKQDVKEPKRVATKASTSAAGGTTLQSLTQALQLQRSKLVQWKCANVRLAEVAVSEQRRGEHHLLLLLRRIMQQSDQCQEERVLLDRRQHISQLDTNIRTQDAALAPIREVLTDFSHHYDHLITTLHKGALRMPLSGVTLNEPAMHEALDHSRRALDSILAVLRNKSDDVRESAATFQKLDNVTKRSKSELVSCKRLLERLQALEIEERSLMAHCTQVCQEMQHDSLPFHSKCPSAMTPLRPDTLKAPFSPFMMTP